MSCHNLCQARFSLPEPALVGVPMATAALDQNEDASLVAEKVIKKILLLIPVHDKSITTCASIAITGLGEVQTSSDEFTSTGLPSVENAKREETHSDSGATIVPYCAEYVLGNIGLIGPLMGALIAGVIAGIFPTMCLACHFSKTSLNIWAAVLQFAFGILYYLVGHEWRYDRLYGTQNGCSL